MNLFMLSRRTHAMNMRSYVFIGPCFLWWWRHTELCLQSRLAIEDPFAKEAKRSQRTLCGEMKGTSMGCGVCLMAVLSHGEWKSGHGETERAQMLHIRSTIAALNRYHG